MNILIDDDPLIRMTWERAAEKSQKELKTYESFYELMQEIDSIAKDCVFYIDSQLGEDIKGEYEALKLYELGYKNLYLASGLSFSNDKLPRHIKGALSKRPPF